MSVEGQRVVVTGGTGSLGQVIVRRLLSGELGTPEKVVVFSRDEAKQHYMRLSYLHRNEATDEVIYRNSQQRLSFRVGDIRDFNSVLQAVRDADIVVHAAALKQVPTCEYFPSQAVLTNISGPENLIRAIREHAKGVKTVIGVSTDKACKPINVMGMTKALMERMLVEANLECPNTRFVCVRYGNVVASRGSVVPLFVDQIAGGGPVTITMKEMTRFLLSLDRAVDAVFAAIASARRGETYVPLVPAARVVDVAEVLIAGRNIQMTFTGIRPGEKIHEIMVSEDECYRTVKRGEYYVIGSMLPELHSEPVTTPARLTEYSSSEVTLDHAAIARLLQPYIPDARNVDVRA